MGNSNIRDRVLENLRVRADLSQRNEVHNPSLASQSEAVALIERLQGIPEGNA